MTAIALQFDVPSRRDFAVSQDAQSLRSEVGDVLDYANTVSLGLSRRALFEELARSRARASSDNWDGDGALPMSSSAYAYALDFVRALPISLPSPEVFADHDGDAYFEWDMGARRILSVAVGRDGTLHFAGISGYATINGSEVLGESLPQAVLEWAKRVTGARTTS